MKKIRTLALLAFVALMVASCNQNDGPDAQTDPFPADGVIHVAVDVNKPQTRAGMTSANLTDFFMYVENPVVTGGNYSYFVKMKNEGGVWKSYSPPSSPSDPLSEQLMLWQNNTQPVNVTAFHVPFSVVTDDWDETRTISVEEDQTLAANVEKSDILYQSRTVVDPATDLTPDGKMKVKLDHRLSKLNLTLNLGTEFNLVGGGTTVNPITEVKVEGIRNAVQWNAQTNDMSNYGSRSSILPFMAHYTPGDANISQAEARYECILLPQIIANTPDSPTDTGFLFTVKIRTGSKTYSWSHRVGAVLTFAHNTQYNLTLNVGKDVVTLGGFSVLPWEDGGSHDIETN